MSHRTDFFGGNIFGPMDLPSRLGEKPHQPDLAKQAYFRFWGNAWIWVEAPAGLFPRCGPAPRPDPPEVCS